MFDDLLSTRQSWKGERGHVTILEFSRQAVEGRGLPWDCQSTQKLVFHALGKELFDAFSTVWKGRNFSAAFRHG